MKKSFLFKAVCIFVALVLVIQVAVHAEDVIEEVGKAVTTVTVAVGIVMVTAGVGAAILGGGFGAMVGSTTMTAGYLAGTGCGMIEFGSLVVNNVAIILPQLIFGGGGSGGDKNNNQQKNYIIELTEESGTDFEKAVVKMRLKETYSNTYVVPSDSDLWVSHSNVLVSLLPGDFRATSVKTSGTIGIKSIPNVTAPGTINTLEYTLGENVQCVNMKILNSSGSVVYDYTESCPNPASPIPFVWKGIDMSGKKVVPGTYSIKLKAVKKDGTSEDAPLQVLTVGQSVLAGDEEQVYLDANGEAYYTLYANGQSNDTITVRLKDKSGNAVCAVSEQSLAVNFKEDNSSPSVVSNPLAFSATLATYVDGVPVKVEIPGTGLSSGVIKVTTYFNDNTSATDFFWDYSKGNIKMKTGSSELNYNKGSNPSMYFVLLDRVQDLLKAVYAEAGLSYDSASNTLKIDKNKYVNKINSSYDVKVSSDSNTVTMDISGGSQSISMAYDLSKDTVTSSEKIDFAKAYDWDITDGSAMVDVDSPYQSTTGASVAGVKATGISAYLFYRTAAKISSYACTVINSSRRLKKDWDVMNKIANVATKPILRLKDPKIADIVWLNKDNGLIQINGEADASGILEIFITRNGTKTKLANDYVLRSGDKWSVTNSSALLANGENKINTVLKKGKCEVESGDVTVYKGINGEPNLILLSPRDREVFSSEKMNGSDDAKISGQIVKGSLTPGYALFFDGVAVAVNSNGEFNDLIDFYLKEGTNKKTVTLLGKYNTSVNSSLIGAYLFKHSYSSNSYVLRKGDFVFNGDSINQEGFMPIPYDPNHTGVYTGNGNVTEAIWNEVVTRSLNYFWNNNGFWGAGQVPKLVDEPIREKVAKLALEQTNKGYGYDIPVWLKTGKGLRFNLYGHYDGDKNSKFYCSELAYWAWERVAWQEGIDFGIIRKETMFPPTGIDDPDNCSILPAYLFERSMEVNKK